jgi:hypothetical protein
MCVQANHRAEEKRIKTIEPDTTQRQKSPQSELQKENIKLRTELAKLQNQVPILSLILTQPEVDIKDTPQPFKVLYRSVDLKDEAKELADCNELESQSSLNKQPRNLSMLLIINWDAYRMAILRWIKEYNEIAEQSRRNFGVDLHIQNTGGTPANNVSAIFKFPKIFQFIQCDYNHYGQIRIPPPKPEPQQYPLGISNTAIKMEPRFKMPGIGSVNGPFIRFIEKDNGISLEITLAKLKHHLHRTFACQAGVISVDAAKTFEFEYEITADNMPQKVKGKIPFIFGEENQTSHP